MTLVHDKNRVISNYLINSNKSIDAYNASDFGHFSGIYIRDGMPTGFHNLPVNILLSIFALLDENELRKYAIPVCHKWRQVALLPELWRKLKFQGLHVPQNFICKQLRDLSNLQCVYFVNIPNATTIIRQLCRCNPHLVKIAIKNCKNDKSCDRLPENVLRNLVASCRKLQEINLKGTPFYGNLFYIEVAVLPEIKSINLSNNQFLSTKNIFELILNCQQLEELSCRNKIQLLTDNDVAFLFSNLRATLKSITLDTMELTDVSFKTLLECEKLEKLYLYNALNMSPETFTSIWKKLPELIYLKIQNLQIQPSYFIQLFTEGRPVLCNLKVINFTGSWKLNEECLNAIAECCPNLEKAIFKSCKNIESVDSFLENCRKTTCLNLGFCPKITNQNFVDVSVKLPHLKTFYMDNSRRSIATIMKSNKPKLDVYICLSEYNKNLEHLK